MTITQSPITHCRMRWLRLQRRRHNESTSLSSLFSPRRFGLTDPTPICPKSPLMSTNARPFVHEIESHVARSEWQPFKHDVSKPISSRSPRPPHPSDARVNNATRGTRQGPTTWHNSETRVDPKQDVEQRQTLRRQQAAMRKKRYQRRLQHERETLRRLEVELSRHLARLQQEIKTTQRTAWAKPHVPDEARWKEIAHFQRTKCAQAQLEQQELISAISAQASYLAVMRGFLPAIETQAAIVSSRYMNARANRVLFDYHLSLVNAGYAQVDKIFRHFDVSAPHDGITSWIQRSDQNVQVFEHFNRFTQPFSFKLTHETLWQLATLPHRQLDRAESSHVIDPENTVSIRFRLQGTFKNGETVSVTQRHVGRRFLDETRAVFTWKTYSEDDSTARILLDETGYMYLEPSPTDDGSTVVKVYLCQTPVQLRTSSIPFGPDAQRFYRFMQRSVVESAHTIESALSKLLLEETLSCIEME
ncbi:hypothetical protein PsorP6_015006 [Peronosclerospora sorghi]|uniref:Uncharacterized protein n=1 Tax=Peronosclerospora sorghi TaxID=230839 RepID=A0ACC0VV52_9STRA|nr:hypothetical protein PsorP6_015006 [Peronosclerospora sorghi]